MRARKVSRIAGCRLSSGCLAIRCARDRGHPPPQRRQRVAEAGGGEIRSDCLRLSGQWLKTVRRAPRAEIVAISVSGASAADW